MHWSSLLSHRAFGAGASLALVLAASGAAAEGDERSTTVARALAVEGRAAFANGDYARARELFHRAHALVGAPTISLYEARALVRLGRLTEAAALYRVTVQTPVDPRAPEQFHKAAAEASQELAELEPRLATVTVVVVGSHDGDAPTLTLDGVVAGASLVGGGLPVDPGPHRLDVALSAGSPRTVSFTLAEGEHRRIDLGPEERPPAKTAPASANPDPAPSVHPGGHTSPLRPWAYVSLGVGVAGLGAGIVTGLMAASKHADAERGCPQNQCVEGSAGARDADAFRCLSVASTVGYVVGGVGVATGVTLLIVGSSHGDEHTAGASLFVAPGRAGVRGAF